MRCRSTPGKWTAAKSKMPGSGLATPTTSLSTTQRTGTPSPGPTWQTRDRRSTASICPEALETTPSGRPRAASVASAAMLSGIGHRQRAAMRAWPSTAAASSTSPSAMPTDRTYARSYSRQSRSSAPWADFTAIAA